MLDYMYMMGVGRREGGKEGGRKGGGEFCYMSSDIHMLMVHKVIDNVLTCRYVCVIRRLHAYL